MVPFDIQIESPRARLIDVSDPQNILWHLVKVAYNFYETCSHASITVRKSHAHGQVICF